MKIVKIVNKSDDRRKPTIHIFTRGETILENLIERHGRPHVAYRKEVLPKVFAKLHWPADTKVGWSQTHYCHCGCSPCFVVKDERIDPHQFVAVTIAK